MESDLVWMAFFLLQDIEMMIQDLIGKLDKNIQVNQKPLKIQ